MNRAHQNIKQSEGIVSQNNHYQGHNSKIWNAVCGAKAVAAQTTRMP